MAEYRLHTETIEIPKNTGRRGFLHVVDQLLQLDRIQSVSIDARGNVTYARYVRDDVVEPNIGPKISFETIMPFACVRNGVIVEITVSQTHPAKAISKMFQRVSNERFFPIAFVTGANSTLWEWLRTEDGVEVDNHEEFFGLPVLTDRHLEDYVLLLASAYGRGASITEVQKSFKIIMPQRRDDALDRTSSSPVRPPVGGNAGGVPPVGSSHGVTSIRTKEPGGSSHGDRASPPGRGPGRNT